MGTRYQNVVSLPLAPTGGELHFSMTNCVLDNSYIIPYIIGVLYM